MKDGKRNGKGIMYYVSGDYYNGEWKDNLEHGDGYLVSKDIIRICRWKEGDCLWFLTYEGDHIDGMPHGNGTLRYISGKIYTGEFKNGKKDGKGIMKSLDGRFYDGQFKDGKPHGQGIMYDRDLLKMWKLYDIIVNMDHVIEKKSISIWDPRHATLMTHYGLGSKTKTINCNVYEQLS